jgi:hypothetical protein
MSCKKTDYMKALISLFLVTLVVAGCEKERQQASCDIRQAYEVNASKVNIANGLWGTLGFMEGNCMPVVSPTSTTCKTCPVRRTIRIYEYALRSQATQQSPGAFYESVSTQLIKEVTSDENGFFQTEVPAGQYSIMVVENGKLYANASDMQGGLNPVNFTGGRQNVNLILTYKATF